MSNSIGYFIQIGLKSAVNSGLLATTAVLVAKRAPYVGIVLSVADAALKAHEKFKAKR
jgi:hypothetical protein